MISHLGDQLWLSHLSENGVDYGLASAATMCTFSLARLMQKVCLITRTLLWLISRVIHDWILWLPFSFAPLNDSSRSGFSQMVMSSLLWRNIRTDESGGFMLNIDLLGAILVLEWFLDGTSCSSSVY